MSSGANCRFKEKQPGKWFYELQCYPYGATEDYDTEGPFKTFREASDHLHNNHSNPGGYSVTPLPGCKHDLLVKRDFSNNGATHNCDRCGSPVDQRTPKEKANTEKKAMWQKDHIQFPRLLAEIYAVGLTGKQEKDLMKSMDLTRDEIYELLERADKNWEREKAQ